MMDGLMERHALGECSVLVSHDRFPGDSTIKEGRWHISVAHPTRLPTWEELKDARDRFAPPDLHFIMPLPPRAFWLNVHDFCLHLIETRDRAAIEQWEEEGAFAQSLGFR